MSAAPAPASEPRLCISILTYTRADLVTCLLADLVDVGLLGRGRRYPDVEVLVACNGTPPHSAASVVEAALEAGACAFAWSDNRGFGGGFNRALAHTSARHLFLLSDDVRVDGDIATPVIAALDEADILLCHRLTTEPAGWNVFGDRTLAYAQGYALALRAETWRRLGGFDTRYGDCDYEDMDLSVTAATSGISIVERADLPLRHLVAGTIGYNPERFEGTVRNRRLFAAKWWLPNVPEVP